MAEARDYLTPDYYPEYHCKMGACRSACCEGWPISISMEDYFRLLGLSCSPELRSRLDAGIHPALHPTPERYAQIGPRYDGSCPLRLEDGRCRLHAEMGEGALSAVCRLYPRGVRADGEPECSCADSCEAVLELFLHRDAPLRFLPMRLEIEPPAQAPCEASPETLGHRQALRMRFIGMIQDRALSLPERFLALGTAMRTAEAALAHHGVPRPDDLSAGAPADALRPAPMNGARLSKSLKTALEMLRVMGEDSDSLREYGEAALAYFGGSDLPGQYRRAAALFAERFPQWPRFFEHMLANHMFFARFPFQDQPENLMDEFAALCAVYALLRLLALGWTAEHPGDDALVDACAAAFRLIDHTSFGPYAARVLARLDCLAPEMLYGLLSL